MIVTVGRIGRAHGVRGEVTVEVRTDTPDERFSEGAVLATEPAAAGPLTVRDARWHSGRLLVSFAGVPDRSAAEALRGVLLLAEIGDDEQTGDPEEFYDHQLVGLGVVDVSGAEIGAVTGVIHLPGQDLLSVRLETGAEALIPFVAEIVPEVDMAAHQIVIDPPSGLLDVSAVDAAGDIGERGDVGEAS